MKKAAFFDVDDTILKGNISVMYAKLFWKKGDITANFFAKIMYWAAMHKINKLSYKEMSNKVAKFLKGIEVKKYQKLVKEHFDEVIKNKIKPKVLEQINNLKQKGYDIVLLTASPHLLVDNLGKHLKVNHTIASSFEEKEGFLTGNFKHICYGKMKLNRFEHYIKDKKIKKTDCYFFTDSFSDIDVLKAVGKPVAVDPDKKLRKIAIDLDWTIL